MTSPTLLATADYTILITDRDLSYIGDPIVCWTNIDVTLKFNEPGSGLFTVPAYPWIIDQISAGRRVVVVRNGSQLIAGPIEKWQLERSNDGENAGDGRLTVNFTDDLASIAARLAYPDPSQTIEGQTADNWTWSGDAELGVLALVNANAGPGALTERQVQHLVLAPAVGAATTVTVTAQRMQPLLDVARSMAELGGNFGFRTVQTPANTIQFETYAPEDKSDIIRFGFGLGNLAYISFETEAPTATTVAVGGQGETGADAFMAERNNSADEGVWGRFEKLVSRAGNSDLSELHDEGDKALAEGAPTTRLASNTLDVPDQRFGTNYRVGDIVAVESWPGQQITDLVRTVHLQVYPTSGEYVSATVGSQAATADPYWVRRLREIEDRMGQIERTVQPL